MSHLARVFFMEKVTQEGALKDGANFSTRMRSGRYPETRNGKDRG